MGVAAFSTLEPEHHFFIVGIWSCGLHQSSARADVSLFGCNVKNRVDKKVDIKLINWNFINEINYFISLSGAQGENRTLTPLLAGDFESPASTVPPLGHFGSSCSIAPVTSWFSAGHSFPVSQPSYVAICVLTYGAWYKPNIARHELEGTGSVTHVNGSRLMQSNTEILAKGKACYFPLRRAATASHCKL